MRITRERDLQNGTYAGIRAKSGARVRLTVLALVISCFTLLIIWFLYFSHHFTITSIEVQGLDRIQKEEVENTVGRLLEGRGVWWDRRNLLVLDTKKLATDLKEALFLEAAIVDKSYPNILRLILKERQRSVVVVSKDQLVSVDASGAMTGELSGALRDDAKARLRGYLSKNAEIPIIVMDLPDQTSTSTQIVPQEVVRVWLAAYESLSTSNIGYLYIRVSPVSPYNAAVRVLKGYDILVDLSHEVDGQLLAYKKYLQSDPTAESKIHEYIDLRLKEKMFVK